MTKLYKLILFIVGVSLFAILAGCAAPANHQAMMVRPTSAEQLNPKLKGMMVVDNILGGEKTYALWISKVDSNAFKQALESSLSAYGYLAKFPGRAKYHVDTVLQSMDAPFTGLSVNMKSTVMYKISGIGVDKKYTVSAVGRAEVSDAFVGDKRVKIANERSIHNNIKEFLKRLSSF